MAYLGSESSRHREEGDRVRKREKGQDRCRNERAAAGTCGARLVHRTSVHHCHLHGLRDRQVVHRRGGQSHPGSG